MMDEDSEDSSTSESEDETGEGWTSDVDRKFYKTLACLKKRDPLIYNRDVAFFDNTIIEKVQRPKEEKKKEKPMYLRDYERHLLVEKQGQLSDEETAAPSTANGKSYVQEQKELKDNLKKLLEDSEEEDGSGSLLKVREKTKEEKEKDDEEYTEWLKGQKETVSDDTVAKDLKPLKEYWNDPSLNDQEKFLRDYILNKRYLDSEDKDYIPTYEEIVHDSEGDLSEDEKTLEQQEEFEHKYNFRFEEPDPEFIKRYPRVIGDTLRKKDDSRKEKRDKLKERKQVEKEQKKEELKQLKKMKLQEIQEKIEKLKAITGNATLAFQEDELDEDFDPEKHDRQMREMFSENYYEEDEGDQKPEFPFDDEIDDENWDTYGGTKKLDDIEEETAEYDDNEEAAGTSKDDSSSKKKKKKKKKSEEEQFQADCEDPEFNDDFTSENMDCEYNEDDALAAPKRKGKKLSQFAKVVQKKKPVFDPSAFSSYEEYLEEYYKLDYEDIIGDLPVRFKYRKTVPNDFGLETEEILAARDKELNRWCSVKKTCQYRTEDEELREVNMFKSKKGNLQLKKKILTSVYNEGENEEESGTQPEPKKLAQTEPKQAAKRKAVEGSDQEKQTKKAKVETQAAVQTEVQAEPAADTEQQQKKKKKKKKKQKNNQETNSETNPETKPELKAEPNREAKKFPQKKRPQWKKEDYSMGMTDERLKAYGFNPKKFKNKQKYGKQKEAGST
nr:EOG090X05XL [Eulimnadia texana]